MKIIEGNTSSPDLLPPWVGLLPDDANDRALVENVRPDNWRNPRPSGRYHLVVVGAGAAGLVAAAGAAGLGAKVALIERNLLGGDCLNVGCVPSKALIRTARSMADVRGAHEFGVQVPPGAHVNFADAMTRMRRLRSAMSPVDSAHRFQQLGVDVYFGQACFVGRDSIAVAGQILRFKKAVIATGARAAAPPIPGLANVGYLTNETLFALTQLPQRLAIIGAGPIGCELAQTFARFGSKVVLIDIAPGIMPNEDRDAAELVARSLARDGIQILVNTQVRDVTHAGDGKRLTLESQGEQHATAVDEILVGAGRVANVDGLGLESAGVQFNRSGVHVDARLRSTNRRIYAAGDICSQFKFTHAADAMARIAIRNALFMGRTKFNPLALPWCTYTDPEIAHVGMYERDVHERGITPMIFEHHFNAVDRAILDGQIEGFVRVITKKGSDRILGATIVASHAGDMISELAVAISGGLGLKKIAQTIHPYPTQAECIKRVADAYNRSRLTPRVKSLFETWFAWTR